MLVEGGEGGGQVVESDGSVDGVHGCDQRVLVVREHDRVLLRPSG